MWLLVTVVYIICNCEWMPPQVLVALIQEHCLFLNTVIHEISLGLLLCLFLHSLFFSLVMFSGYVTQQVPGQVYDGVNLGWVIERSEREREREGKRMFWAQLSEGCYQSCVWLAASAALCSQLTSQSFFLLSLSTLYSGWLGKMHEGLSATQHIFSVSRDAWSRSGFRRLCYCTLYQQITNFAVQN